MREGENEKEGENREKEGRRKKGRRRKAELNPTSAVFLRLNFQDMISLG